MASEGKFETLLVTLEKKIKQKSHNKQKYKSLRSLVVLHNAPVTCKRPNQSLYLKSIKY